MFPIKPRFECTFVQAVTATGKDKENNESNYNRDNIGGKKVAGTAKRKGAYPLFHSRGQFSKAEPGEKAANESLERSHF